MCGRYAASADPDDLVEVFEIDHDAMGEPTRSLLVSPQQPPVGQPDYNVAPSKAAPIVLEREPGQRQLRPLTWGLVPSWSKDPRSGVRMINARAETLLSKPAYAKAAMSRRCLVPATGWYEWQVSPTATGARGRPRKQPFFLSRADDVPLAMAGIYEFWKEAEAPQSEWLVTFAVITTAAEPGLDRIHDRQPVVLDSDRWQSWLDPTLHDRDEVEALLQPPDPGRFTTWPVSAAVNAVGNNSPSLLEAIPTGELVGVVDPLTGELLG
ncbi:MAG: SOS response-associated peptidase [Ornithinimicrobium sp.]